MRAQEKEGRDGKGRERMEGKEGDKEKGRGEEISPPSQRSFLKVGAYDVTQRWKWVIFRDP